MFGPITKAMRREAGVPESAVVSPFAFLEEQREICSVWNPDVMTNFGSSSCKRSAAHHGELHRLPYTVADPDSNDASRQ
jgi:hypothetical protein